jgi:prephenate dehydrogenase
MPADSAETHFKHIAILGTGLIGGSFGLAVREYWPSVKVTGWDRAEVLGRAREAGAIAVAAPDLESAVRDADLVYIALPVHAAMEMLPAIARAARPAALITDACGTKVTICRLAAKVFGESGGAAFLGGHPVAGKERSGVENASKDLFRGSRYGLVTDESEGRRGESVEKFVALVKALGAIPVFCDAETHDWATAIVSHLPQLVSIALAGVVQDETDETDGTGLPALLAGTGLRDMARLAGSPYDVWRDICLTNTTNISRALDRLAQHIDYLRANLATRELQTEFESANRLYKTLREMQ